MSVAPIRTLLIDDSALMCRLIGDMIRNDPTLDLVGIAADGLTGTTMALDLKPDVIVTDMVMPRYDGAFVVKEVMEKRPTPIILLSSLEKTNARIFDALQDGAFDFIDKPVNLDRLDPGYPLVQVIHEAARADINVLRAKQTTRKNNHKHTFSSSLQYDIVVIGASTGGPGAIEHVVNNLPANFEIPVVIAQHMPARFLETFAERLNVNSPIPVRLGRRGESVNGGNIYILSGESNSRIERNLVHAGPIITHSNRKYAEFNCPSVDCLFESVADVYGSRCIGVLLTGMGKDGVLGLEKIKRRGGFTIAQDEESSVVYGMPKAAVEKGVVKQVVKLRELPGFIVSCL